MAAWIFPFHKVGPTLIRPWVAVEIVNPANNASVKFLALLDTGADRCVFPKAIAEQLGMTVKDDHIGIEDMQGLGGVKIPVWHHEFRINLLSPDRNSIVWKSKNLVIGCVDHDNIPPILGFLNFMANFKITFNHASRKIVIDDRPII